MGATTGIAWTDATWNPVTGCTKVSPGCDHCYAERFAERFRGVPGHVFEQGFDLKLWPERLDWPRHWCKPRRIFVNSMSDLFHKDVPDEFIARVFKTMILASGHIFQVLTKRPERMRRFVPRLYSGEIPLDAAGRCRYPADNSGPQNIWLGVSIESNAYAWRADMLRETPSAVRFLSLEPLLGPVGEVSFEGIDWVIVGGESGAGARPMDPAWARDVRDRCEVAGIPFFLKQLGGARDKRANESAVLDGRTWTEFPR